VPQEVHQAFAVVTKARDRAVEYVAQAYREGRHPKGFEVDQAAREVLEGAGFGAYILHRTGHNLGFSATHGNGTHLDGLETHDTRPLIPGLAFTVEPGIYPQGIASATGRDGSLGPWGLRSEINVYLHESGPEITTGVQREIDRL
jgi:Xaa-Pro aminopeptidase